MKKYPERNKILLFFIDIYKRYDKRLNDPLWLYDAIRCGKSEVLIAHEIKCSITLVHAKITEKLAHPDQGLGIYTGYFHSVKWLVYPLIKRSLKQIEKGVDSVYDKTTSRNSKIFKTIIQEIEDADEDIGDGNFIMHHVKLLGISRKQLYILILKFMICLYEYDWHYTERADYALMRLLEMKDEIYIDKAIADPANWYPHRNNAAYLKYLVQRNQRNR